MKGRLARSIVLSMAGAFAATVEGASSRLELSGGPVARRGNVFVAQTSLAPIVLSAGERRVRPLEPGEVLVLGPTATPLSAPPIPARAAAPVTHPVPSPTAISPVVDTVTVRATTAPADARPPGNAESWETFRSGNVVRIDIPRN